MTESFRTASRDELAGALQEARDTSLALVEALVGAGLEDPVRRQRFASLDPPLWELGHIAWFAEWFVLRGAVSSAPGSASTPSMLKRGDEWFDAHAVPPPARWTLELPKPGGIKTYCHEVLDRALDKLSRAAGDDRTLYPYRLVLAHEDIRGEGMAAALQTIGARLPGRLADHAIRPWAQGEIRFPGGTIVMGSAPQPGFVFDNEKMPHARHVPPFTMDSTLVSNAQYAEFITDGGYRNWRWWTPGGRAWLQEGARQAPRDWVREGKGWRCQRFGQSSALPPHEPARHLSLYEAQAYCAWAGRRLPTEVEWEFAALSGHPAFRWGDLWEWTGSPFEPYPGFVPEAWSDYSAPCFGSHQVLRGASFATRVRMRTLKFRHFALPRRNDMFVGFRTCI